MSRERMRNSGLICKDPWSKCLRAQPGRGKRGMCRAQWASGQTLQVLKPQHLVQTSIWPGHWCGERGWLCTHCWPEAPWVIIFFRLEFPGDHNTLQEPGCPEHGVWGCSVLQTRLFQTPLWWGTEAGPPVKMPVFDPNKL